MDSRLGAVTGSHLLAFIFLMGCGLLEDRDSTYTRLLHVHNYLRLRLLISLFAILSHFPSGYALLLLLRFAGCGS